MKIRFEISGTSPVLFHNDRLSIPNDAYTRQIAEITAKGKNQTDRDREDVARLEWYGSLYLDDNRKVVVPSSWIVRCCRDSAGQTKDGKKIARALNPLALQFPLQYEGPENIDELWGDPMFRFQKPVKTNRGGRVLRTRPMFRMPWAIIADFMLIDTQMSFSKIGPIIDDAGLCYGLGDGRIIGFGRFRCKISKL
jgi:hypothetical protein